MNPTPVAHVAHAGPTANHIYPSILNTALPRIAMPAVTAPTRTDMPGIARTASSLRLPAWTFSVASRVDTLLTRPSLSARVVTVGALGNMALPAFAGDPVTLTVGMAPLLALGAAVLLGAGAFVIHAVHKAAVGGKGFDEAKQAFETELARWLEGLTNDRGQIADFTVDVELKDRITALKIKGEKTQALYAQVIKLRDELVMGIEGLEARVKKAEETVSKGKRPNAETYRQALAILTGNMTFTAGDVAQGILFDAIPRSVTITNDTVSELKTKIPQALNGWKRIKDAAHATLHDVRTDFSDKDLLAMQALLAKAGIPDEDAGKILETHPLAKSPLETWTRLNTLKDSDPVAYLDELTTALKIDDDLEVYVSLLAEDFVRAKDMQNRVERTDVWKGLDQAFKDEAQKLLAELISLIQSRASADAIDRKAGDVVSYYENIIAPKPATVPVPPPVSPPVGERPATGDGWWGQGNGGLSTEPLPDTQPLPQGEQSWDMRPETSSDEAERRIELARREAVIRQRKEEQRARSGGGYESLQSGSVLDEIMRGSGG